jgi:hypothetical protein
MFQRPPEPNQHVRHWLILRTLIFTWCRKARLLTETGDSLSGFGHCCSDIHIGGCGSHTAMVYTLVGRREWCKLPGWSGCLGMLAGLGLGRVEQDLPPEDCEGF